MGETLAAFAVAMAFGWVGGWIFGRDHGYARGYRWGFREGWGRCNLAWIQADRDHPYYGHPIAPPNHVNVLPDR